MATCCSFENPHTTVNNDRGHDYGKNFFMFTKVRGGIKKQEGCGCYVIYDEGTLSDVFPKVIEGRCCKGHR